MVADNDVLRQTDIVIRLVWGITNPDDLSDDEWAAKGQDARYVLGLCKDIVESAVAKVVNAALGGRD